MKHWVLAIAISALTSLTTTARAVELSLWAPAFFTPAAGLPELADTYRDLYERFEVKNPGIKIKFEVIPGNIEALRHFLNAAGANNLPDLALLDSTWVARLSQTGKLQSINDLWSTNKRADLLPDSLNLITIDGRIYAVPFHTSLRGIIYQKDLLAKLGFDSAPATWDRFLAYAEAATSQ